MNVLCCSWVVKQSPPAFSCLIRPYDHVGKDTSAYWPGTGTVSQHHTLPSTVRTITSAWSVIIGAPSRFMTRFWNVCILSVFHNEWRPNRIKAYICKCTKHISCLFLNLLLVESWCIHVWESNGHRCHLWSAKLQPTMASAVMILRQ